jgi:hypothetical protein
MGTVYQTQFLSCDFDISWFSLYQFWNNLLWTEQTYAICSEQAKTITGVLCAVVCEHRVSLQMEEQVTLHMHTTRHHTQGLEW